jgi:hypothetical protein
MRRSTMKPFVKFMVYTTYFCAFLSFHPLLMAAELIAPTRTLDSEKGLMEKLSVFSEPPGLDVTLDGTEIGKTPIISREVESGPHIIRIQDSETKIFVIPGKALQYSWFKGSFIEIPERKKEVQQPETKDVKTPQKTKSKQKAEKEIELQPLYWPLNPRGPIF